MNHPISRRAALQRLTTGAALAAAVTSIPTSLLAAPATSPGRKGRIKQSVCKWCYSKVSLDDLCVAGKEMGLSSIELLAPEDFPTLKKHGLGCAMVTFPVTTVGGVKIGSIPHAWNRLEHHDTLVAAYTKRIQETADAGFNNVICFSGNRAGMDDKTGMENCAVGLAKIMPLADKLGVTVTMELLNSKVNHKDYMCDHSAWGVGLCQKLGSERFKLLYDIYHMQIMEGDVIATIRDHHQWFSHYHTGGVPGRAEIDETQELNYPAIMRAILETGYKGYVGQEFVPKRPDVLASLRQSVDICDV